MKPEPTPTPDQIDDGRALLWTVVGCALATAVFVVACGLRVFTA